ncbi:hypothetical protein GCM10010191_11410 [Actinomadura vinacea]|uniref:Sigma-70 family RNA polymerase sigma factor n=1 Tax=Actinomadura vinacea TaxID=115336 RepID=A0ABN3IJD3_9ACTN
MDAMAVSGQGRRQGRTGGSVFAKLNLEWAELRNAPDINGIVASWARDEPALAGLSSLTLIERAKAGPVDARIDSLLAALVRRASSTCPDAAIAARVVLQLMLPKTARIARAHAWLLPDSDEREQLAVWCMYNVIRTFPPRVTHHVPPHLAWGAHHAMRKEVLAQVRELPSDTVEPLRRSKVNASEELAHLLTWAVARRVISAQDADLLVARYGDEADGRRHSWKHIGDLQRIAAETGLSPDAVKKRCSRATRKLAAAAKDYLAVAVPDE